MFHGQTSFEYVAIGFAALCLITTATVWLVLERRYAGELAIVYGRLAAATTRAETERTARLEAQAFAMSAMEETKALRELVLQKLDEMSATSDDDKMTPAEMIKAGAITASSLVLAAVPLEKLDKEMSAKCAALGGLMTVHNFVGYAMEIMLREHGVEPLYSVSVRRNDEPGNEAFADDEDLEAKTDPSKLQ